MVVLAPLQKTEMKARHKVMFDILKLLNAYGSVGLGTSANEREKWMCFPDISVY